MFKNLFFCAFFVFGPIFFAKGQQKVIIKTGSLPGFKGTLKGIFLAGDFNNWNPADTLWEMAPGADKSLSVTRELVKGTYSFKVTRGSWQTVECGPLGQPVENRIVHINHDTVMTLKIEGWQDNFKQPEKKHTASVQVHVISDNFYIPQLDRMRRIWIYLPKNYAALKKRYPVIYMQDGQNLFDAYTSAYGEWGVDKILNSMPAKEQCIIVGIDHGGDNRLTEYNPYDSKFGKGRGKDYAGFLANTLKPYIDKHYRTLPGPAFTAVAGSSMGGLISMFAILEYPGVFGSAGIFSPAFWIAPEIYNKALETNVTAASHFYFVCGDSESDGEAAEMQKMAGIIKQKLPGTQVPVVVVKGAKHNEAQWHTDFPAFYTWFNNNFKPSKKVISRRPG